MIPKTRPAYPERMRYESLFGKFRPGEPVYKLTYPDRLRYENLVGSIMRPQDRHKLPLDERLRFRSLIGNVHEFNHSNFARRGDPVDLLGAELRAKLEEFKLSPECKTLLAQAKLPSITDDSTSAQAPNEAWSIDRTGSPARIRYEVLRTIEKTQFSI